MFFKNDFLLFNLIDAVDLKFLIEMSTQYQLLKKRNTYKYIVGY